MCSARRSSSKSRTMKRSSTSDESPSRSTGWTYPSRPSVVSGERLSCGRRARICPAILIAFTSSPFAQPGWIARPWMRMRTCAPENVSVCSSPAVEPSTV